MSWHALAGLGLVVRPISGPRPPALHEWSRFDSTLGSTVALLARELRMLDAKNVVLEADFTETQLRHDGFPRAGAREPDYPGIILSFESRYGPVRMATATYRRWTENLRAIALSMEALRAVDRYGVSKRGEQYQGWKALPRSTDAADQIQTVGQARELLEEYGGLNAALKATHPDRGGDPDEFRKVMRAKELVAG